MPCDLVCALRSDQTRVLPELPADAVVRLVDGPEGRGLEVVSPGAPPGAASRLAEFFPLGHTQGNEDSVLPPVGHCVGVCLCGECLPMRAAFVPCCLVHVSLPVTPVLSP